MKIFKNLLNKRKKIVKLKQFTSKTELLEKLRALIFLVVLGKLFLIP